MTFYFYFFDPFYSPRSTKEVTTENMSLNKSKAWPMENLEVLLKIDKKLVTTKRGSFDQFLAKINFFEPGFSFLSIFGLLIFFWDSLTFSFYFFDIFSSLRSTKEVTTENMSLNK